MPFTVEDFQDLVRLLRERPEWRDELRRVLLTDELLELPRLMRALTEEVRRLAEAQAKTGERVGRLEEALARLAEAQLRTEERVGRLEERVGGLEERTGRLEEAQIRLEQAVARLAEAQLKTEERVGRLEERVGGLEERTGRLEEAQIRLEQAVARLAAAQAKTERAVQELAVQVGRLSDAVGFTLEELARELGPAYLARHYGIQVESLERRFFTVDGEEVEVDLFGEGTRDGERVVVVGEVRSRIYGRDVETLHRRVRSLAPQLVGTPVPTLFGFVIHPSAREAADRTGVLLIAAVGK
jgi:tetratricopeptide (TPR) repeat protein